MMRFWLSIFWRAEASIRSSALKRSSRILRASPRMVFGSSMNSTSSSCVRASITALDFLAGRGVNPLFGFEKIFQDLARLASNGVRILDEFHFFELRKSIHHSFCQLVDLVARHSHSTALYFCTSCCFTFLNIS